MHTQISFRNCLVSCAEKLQHCDAGDSHSTALTSQGAVYAWGTYRDATGVFGFAPGKRIGLLPTLVWEPKRAADQAVKLASGTLAILCCC